jgi:DNA invertase Pin-like site-specific DNA recombinase
MASERSTARINYDLSEMSSTDRRGIGSPVARKDYVDRRRRQAQGQARAKAEGRYKGRPEDVDRNTAIGRMLASKQSWGVIQSVTGYSRTIIAKIAKRLKPAA